MINRNFEFKKISIVTPTLNQDKYIEETILSIINQNYPNLEYIIIDGGSTDKSIEIIKNYEKYITYWISEPDKGMYDALNKGFSKTTGEIMGWLNSDDKLHSKSLFTLNEIFHFPNIKWLQGTPTAFDEKGRTIGISNDKRWSKYEFWVGANRWIQQESTYWKRELWEKAGEYIDTNFKYAGDFELWNRFFKYEKLYTPNVLIGGFRQRNANQLSLNFMNDYKKEAKKILKNNNHSQIVIKITKNVSRLLKTLQKTKIFNILPHRIRNKIKQLHNYPPFVRFDRINQKFVINEN